MTSKEHDDTIIAELRQIADKARDASATFKPHEESIKKLYAAAIEIGNAWSKGWIGYHSRVYKRASN